MQNCFPVSKFGRLHTSIHFLDNPTGSVFCAHGAGFVVDWALVPEYAHLDTAGLLGQKPEMGEMQERGQKMHLRIMAQRFKMPDPDYRFRDRFLIDNTPCANISVYQ